MKLFAALLAASTIAVVAPATAQAQSCYDGFNEYYCGDGPGRSAGNKNGNNRGNVYSNDYSSDLVTDQSGNNRGNDTVVDSNGVLGNRNEVVSTDGNKNRINTGTINRGTLAGAEEGAVSSRAVIREGAVDVDNTVTGGDQRNVVRDSGNSSARGGDQEQSQSQSQSSSNSNTNSSQSNNSNSTSSRSSSDNNGNAQTLNYTNIDIPEATVAPLPENGVPGQIGDVIIPLPSIRGGVFTTRDNDIFYGGDRSTTGATIGFQIPLGTGQVVAAAEQIVARRESAQRFQLIREATWMLQQGVLSEQAHPEHWAALYGAPPVAPAF